MVCPLGCPQMFAPPTILCRAGFVRHITQIAAFPYIAPAVLVIWEGLGRFRFRTSPSPLRAFSAAGPSRMGPIQRAKGSTPPFGGGPPRPPVDFAPSTSPSPARRRLRKRPRTAPGGPGPRGTSAGPVLPPQPRCRLCKRPCAAPGGHGRHQHLLLPSTRPTFHLVATLGQEGASAAEQSWDLP